MSDNNPIRTIEEVTAVLEEQELTKEQLMSYLRQVLEIRALEDNIANLLSKAVLKGASHLYAGQEAVAVGAVAALRDDDLVTSTHRGHGHAHAHGDKAASTPAAKQEHYNKMMAEVLGKSGGYCKGKGGSMHIADVAHGNLGATGIVGGNIPVAVGAALAQKLMGTIASCCASSAKAHPTPATSTSRSIWLPCGTCRSSSWQRTTSTPCPCPGSKPAS